MKEHPRILQARVRLAPPPKVAILGKDVSSWQEEEEQEGINYLA
jgi:hypothetical protein